MFFEMQKIKRRSAEMKRRKNFPKRRFSKLKRRKKLFPCK